MENYQILALCVFVPACVYFNYRAGFNAGLYAGINSALGMMEVAGAITVKIVDGVEVVTINGKEVGALKDMESKKTE
jgi:hypothetical protein